MNSTAKTILIWIAFILAAVLLYKFVARNGEAERRIAYSEFVDSVQQGVVLEVTIVGDDIRGTMKSSTGRDPERFRTVKADDPKLVETLRANNVKVSVGEGRQTRGSSFCFHPRRSFS